MNRYKCSLFVAVTCLMFTPALMAANELGSVEGSSRFQAQANAKKLLKERLILRRLKMVLVFL